MNKSSLLKALEVVKPGLSNKDTVEQTDTFGFKNGRVTTYNDEISISHPVDIDVEGCIKAEELYAFLKKVKGDEIEISLENNEIQFKAGRAKAGLTLNSKVSQPLGEIDAPKKWMPLPENFSLAIKMAAEVVKKDITQPILNCVHLKSNYVESTDNYRIYRYKFDNFNIGHSMLLPAKSAKELIKINPTEISVGDEWIILRNKENTEFACRTKYGEFPNVIKFLKVKGEKITFPKSVLEIVDRAEVFAKRDDIFDEEITVEVKNEKIHFSSSSDTGWFKEYAKVKCEHNFKFSMTPILFKDILNETRTSIFNGKTLKFSGNNWEYLALLKE
jgi:DNA polymerase III sliding clamp (beta) subunit (PCNA family)